MAKYLDSNGLSHFMTLIKTALSSKADTTAIPGPYDSTPEMDGVGNKGSSNLYARGNHVHPTDTSRQATLVSGTNIKTVGSQSLLGSGNLTPANIGAAATSHSHGNITSGGDITATPPTVASGDKLIINDESASKVTNGPSFGTSTTTYLRNDGQWGTPAGTVPGIVPVMQQSSISDDSGFLYWDADNEVASLDDTGTLMTSAEKTKLSGIATGAEVNQNAFSNVKVGSTTVSADGKTDTLELAAGSNVTLTPDATNDKVTIAATDSHVLQHGEANTNNNFSILFTGTPGQQSGAIDSVGFDSAKDFKYNPSTGNLTVTKINNYTLGAACAKSIGAVADGNTGLVTGDAVYDAIQAAVTSALTYKGTVSAESSLLNVALSAGWMYIVTMPDAQTSSIVIGGHTVEEGDTIIVKTAGTYTSGSALGAAIDVIQSDIDALTTTEIDALWAAA